MMAWPRQGATTLLVVALMLVATNAWSSTRVLLLAFDGRKADVLRDKVAGALEAAGHSVVLSKSASESTSVGKMRSLAKKARADVVVTGSVARPSMRSWSVQLTVRDGKRGQPLGREVKLSSSWLPGLVKEITDNAGDRLSVVFDQAGESRADTPEAPEVDDGVAAEERAEAGDANAVFDADSAASPERDARAPLSVAPTDGTVVSLRVRGGLVRRSLDFVDDIYARLRTQRANMWVYQVEGALYPFARPIGERLGLIASYESVFSGSVKDTDFGTNFDVQFSEFFAGVRARHPLGDHQLGFDLTFGQMSAGLLDDRGVSNSPDLTYTLLRAALGVTFDFGDFQANGVAAFRLPLGYGQIGEAEWFPRIGGYGVEASGGLEYALSQMVSVEISTSLRRFVLEMNSEPRDAMEGIAEVAGGAIDLYVSAYAGVKFRL